jgi:uncharacterized membrane protein (UPF0127 family)
LRFIFRRFGYVLDMVEFVRLGLLLVCLSWFAVGCDKTPDTDPGPSASQPGTNHSLPYLDHAQPRLPTIKLWIGAQEMVTEIARQQVEVNTGMMHRKQMGENDGMLFVMPYPHRTSFYMRNTLVPLSAAYIDPEGTIVEIHDLKPLDETPVEAQSDKIQYVLETPQGWFKKNNIGPGTLIRTEKGSLEQTFWKQP